MTDNVLILREKLLHWLAFALTAAAAVLMGGGCSGLYEGQDSGKLPSFATDRTLVFKLAARPLPAATAEAPTGLLLPAVPGSTVQQFVAATANAVDVRKMQVRIYHGEKDDTGVARESELSLPPYEGTLVIRGVRPGRKLVTVDAYDALGALLYSGEQLVDFAPGAAKFVEFTLMAAPPAAAGEFHGGPVTADLRLAVSQSPYTITSPVVIAATGNLVVEGGVELRFSTPASATPDLLVLGKLLLGSADRASTLRRVSGRSLGPRVRFENSSGSTLINAAISGTSGAAVELSGASALISTCTVTDAAVGVLASGSTPTVRHCTFTAIPRGVVLQARSTAQVDSCRFTDSTTAVSVTDSAAMIVSNVIEAGSGVVNCGISIERSAATVAQNRVTATTGTFDPSTGQLLRGLDRGISVVDSLSGTASSTGRVLIDHNTIQGAVTAGIVIIASDPLVSYNRLLNGQGAATTGSLGIAVNLVLDRYPRQPSFLSNDIVGNSGPAVAYLTDVNLEPAGGGVLGNPGRDGNYIQGNNRLNLGFVPGVDSGPADAVDGVFRTRTYQVFGVDAILAVSSTAIAQAGAPATVR
jgi:hypothetical protein